MKRQRGVTFVGMIFIAGLIIIGAIIALKLVPAYIEYATVVQHLREIARSPEARGGSPREIKMMFSKRAQIDDIRAVTAEDIEVSREGDSVILTASYQTKVKLFGNLSACIDFEASSSKLRCRAARQPMSDEAIQRRLGYRFQDASLLRQALTHRSYGTPHNERLEFLGDGLLNFVVARLLFEQFAKLPEGELSRLRASLVNQHTLAEIAASLSLGEHLRLGEGELKSGGFRRPSILADAFEALIGAILLDGGFGSAEQVLGQLYQPLLAATDPTALGKDPKTRLQEYLQAKRMALPQYAIVTVSGEAHEQHFRVECTVPELNIRAYGVGTNRRAAEQEAARSAYELAAEIK